MYLQSCVMIVSVYEQKEKLRQFLSTLWALVASFTWFESPRVNYILKTLKGKFQN